MLYNFEWDPGKAKDNWIKHKIRFEHAATVFHDPEAVSIFDGGHSDIEDRRITLGISSIGGLLVVHHTYDQIDDQAVKIRIFPSLKATKQEQNQYKVRK